MGNGGRLKMPAFVRSLPEQLVDALEKLAEENGANWWKEILHDPNLHLAIREDYLSVYARGQSVFKIWLGKEMNGAVRRPLMSTHYKYLLIPEMPRDEQYATFDGTNFRTKGQPIKPCSLIQTYYIAGETVPQLVKSAVSHSNPEKRGVHDIAKNNPNVIDMEIAFSKERDPEPEDPTRLNEDEDDNHRKLKSTAPRMDLAALHKDGSDKARLVFYEVKRFDDGRLWGKEPPVLDQMKKYDKFLSDEEETIKTAYQRVCKALFRLLRLRRQMETCPLIRDVANDLRRLEIDKTSRLVVIGFDRDQKKGRLKELESMLTERGLADRLLRKGSPKQFELRR